MHLILDDEEFQALNQKLLAHPIFASITSIERLQIFMQHHVFAVWDFMALLKSLQKSIAPTDVPWMPAKDTALRRFVNEIVTEEESDRVTLEGEEIVISHYDLYLRAMREVGAQTAQVEEFLELVIDDGLECALVYGDVPESAGRFVRSTFMKFHKDKAHVVASAFAFGREKLVPAMFKALIERMAITREQAPAFYCYLERHMQVDEESHGPLALQMIDVFAERESSNMGEMLEAAKLSLQERILFWDGVLEAIVDAEASTHL